MDIGIFKATKTRLVAWIVVPPVLITSVGLSSYALQQKAEWRLAQIQSLSEVLPEVVQAQKDVQQLFADLGLSEDNRIASKAELIALLQDKARIRKITCDAVDADRREKVKGSDVPVLSAVVEASGDFLALQLFLNDIKSAQPLLSASSISLSQRIDQAEGRGDFKLKAVFDLLLVDDVLKATGGSK